MLQSGKQFGDIGRIILSIAVQGSHHRTTGMLNTRDHSRTLSEIALMADEPQAGNLPGQPVKLRHSVIGTAVVHIKDFKGDETFQRTADL